MTDLRHTPLYPPSMGEFIRWYFQDRPSCHIVVPVDDENTYPEIVSPFRKGGEGDLSFFLLGHCEERLVRRGNLCHPVCHYEESDVFYRTT